MKVIIINKMGSEWMFASVRMAKPHIKKECFKHFRIENRGGEKVRVYDDSRCVTEMTFEEAAKQGKAGEWNARMRR
jgi:hypothetical protein